MNTRQAFNASMAMNDFILNSYLSDLNDSDLLRRPGTGCNHLAWQLGHLIAAEADLLNSVCPGKGPELPAGFREAHAKTATSIDDPAQFRTKQEYQELYAKVRAATVAAIEGMTDADFDKPAPERFQKMFPTVGHMFLLIASHPLMHAGQFVVVRRQLGKPVLI